MKTADTTEDALHEALNDLLALVHRNVRGLNIEARCYHVLAASVRKNPDRPITVAFADDVRALLEDP